MTQINTQTTTTDYTTQAQHLFTLEDRLERDYSQGWLTDEEYNRERTQIFQTLGDLYGFEG